MENFISQLFTKVTDFWKAQDTAIKRRIIVGGVLILVALSTLLWVVTRKEYTVLYRNLDPKEAGEILTKIEEMNYEAKPQDDGTILVLKDDEARLRMLLAAEGYPKSGVTFDTSLSATGIGATDYDKKIAEKNKLQQSLQQSIKTLNGVADAIVIISIPDESSFVLKEDKKEPSASVLLTLESGTEALTKKNIKAIEALVSRAVLGLKPENISIVDNNMNLLNVQDSTEAGVYDNNFELQKQVKEALENQVTKLLEPVFGKGNVKSAVNVKLNFDKQFTEIVRFEPVVDDQGIAVSINELKEEVTGQAGGVTYQAQGVTDEASQYPVTQDENGSYKRTESTTNYEVNQIKEQIEKAQGKIEELTLSVIINSDVLSDERISQIQNILAKGLGVDTENVVVLGMSFDGQQQEQAQVEQLKAEAQAKERNERIFNYLRLALIALGGLLVFIMILRYIQRIQVLANPQELEVLEEVPVEEEEEELGKLPDVFMQQIMEMPEESKEQIAQKQQIEYLIENKPDLVAQQIRDWINES